MLKLVIDNLTATDVYVEKRNLVKILCNNEKNNKGMLEVDENGNNLISNIDSGDTPLYRVSKYTGEGSVLFYNPTTKNMQIVGQSDFLNIDIDFERGTKYYLDAKIISSNKRNKSVFDIELGDYIPLKVFLDGREINTYVSDRNTLTIKGTDTLLLDIFSEITVYVYKTTNINSPSIELELEYYQYDSIWDKESFFSDIYFEETLKLIPLKCFESLSITQNVGKTTYRDRFMKSSRTKINYIDNISELEIFDTTVDIDMTQWCGREEFRLIFINPHFGRCILLNNCKIDNGISIVFDKSKNTKKFNLSCGNYIDIKIGEPSAYGAGKYGKGLYGTNTYIYNSHKVGD